ncbi:MAG: HEPN domain-containing protein [Bacteroidetes bacterium]|nr:HEPN domain-containing protein [Bacteroidota bacterium]
MDQKLRATLDKWQFKAENDIKTAQLLLESEEPITDSICFHSQQAVEKFLKLYLVYKGIEPVKTHIISELLVLCIKISGDFSKLNDVDYLTEYAVSMRYPDDFYIPIFEEAEQALEDAIKVRDFVLNKII